MFRIALAVSVLTMGVFLLSVDAQDVKKKEADTTLFTGKLTDVNFDEGKKLESLYVEVVNARRINNRGVRIDDKTKFEFTGFKTKNQEVLKPGQGVTVKMNPVTDTAVLVKVSPTAPKLVIPPRPKVVKKK